MDKPKKQRKDYHVKVTVIDLQTEEPEGKPRIYNFSNRQARINLEGLIFACINTGKGVAIELDKAIPVT